MELMWHTIPRAPRSFSPFSHTCAQHTLTHTASFPWWCSLSESEGCTLIAVDTCEVCVWSNDDTLDTTLVLTLLIPVITSAFYTQLIFPVVTTICICCEMFGCCLNFWWSYFERRPSFCKFLQVLQVFKSTAFRKIYFLRRVLWKSWNERLVSYLL